MMRITKYGHACFLIEEANARILFDPGNFSHGFERLDGLDAILITHQHPDHFVPDNIRKLILRSLKLRVFADVVSAGLLQKSNIEAKAVKAGDTFEVAGVGIEVFGEIHEVIHPDIPDIPDVGYMVGGRFFYPGDAYTVPNRPVELLAAPAGAPWLRVHEAIDYIRAVRPKVAFPAHDAVLSDDGQAVHNMLLSNLGRAGEYKVLSHGKPVEY
jgi:L-ascorbate metabolism protein UlaG (beta-lactamase superfamily)